MNFRNRIFWEVIMGYEQNLGRTFLLFCTGIKKLTPGDPRVTFEKFVSVSEQNRRENYIVNTQ